MATWEPLMNIKGPQGDVGPAGDNAPDVVADWDATSGPSQILNKPPVIASGQTALEARQVISDSDISHYLRGNGTYANFGDNARSSVLTSQMWYYTPVQAIDEPLLAGVSNKYHMTQVIGQLQAQITALKDGMVSGSTPLWVSGSTHSINSYVISPLSSHMYMKKTNSGASTIDPANDKTNWRLIGAGGIKSVQRGSVSMTTTTNALSVTISAVDPDFSEVTLLGVNSSAGGSDFTRGIVAAIDLFNETTLRVLRGGSGASSLGAAVVIWQVIEYWG